MCTSSSSSPIGSSSSRRLHSRASPAPLNHLSPLNFTGLAIIPSLNLVYAPALQRKSVAGSSMQPISNTRKIQRELCTISREASHPEAGSVNCVQHHLVWLHHAMRLLVAAYCAIASKHGDATLLRRATQALTDNSLYIAAHYRLQFGDRMSTSEYGLVQLRQEMAQGREDTRPGSSLQNKAEGYWIPLQQVEHLLFLLLSRVTVCPPQQC